LVPFPPAAKVGRLASMVVGVLKKLRKLVKEWLANSV